MTIDTDMLSRALLTLCAEAYDGPENPKMTWFVDNEPKCGMLGSLEMLSAEEASKPLSEGKPITAATHANHVRFSLNLANRALRGESVHATANWAESWKVFAVDEAAWKELLAGLRAEYLALREAISAGMAWGDETNFTGLLGQLAHGAWHLGALRQGLGLVTLRKS